MSGGKTIVTVRGMPGFWEVAEDLGDKVVVVRGPLRLELNKDRIATAAQAEEPLVHYKPEVFNAPVAETLDLHGMTVEEALKHLESYLDDARAAGLTKVTVIHGHGSGKLKKGVCDWLKARKLKFEGGQLSRKGFVSQRVYLA